MVVDVGSGTTDIALLDVKIANSVPQISLLNYASIMQAGDDINSEILKKIRFEEVTPLSELSPLQKVILNTTLNVCKAQNSADSFIIELYINEV